MKEIKRLLKSFYYATNGLIASLSERNMIYHILAVVAVVAITLILNLLGQTFSAIELTVLVLTMAAVVAAEIFNTAIEDLANVIRDNLKLDYKATTRARDLGAAGVLVVAIAAVAVGVIIFLPKIIDLIKS